MPDELTERRRASNATCSALTLEGEPCPAPAMRGLGVCLWHSDDPQLQLRATIARGVGQKLSQLRARHFVPGMRLESPADWLAALAALGNDLAALPNTPQRSGALVQVSREAREWVALREALEGRVIEVGDA